MGNEMFNKVEWTKKTIATRRLEWTQWPRKHVRFKATQQIRLISWTFYIPPPFAAFKVLSFKMWVCKYICVCVCTRAFNVMINYYSSIKGLWTCVRSDEDDDDDDSCPTSERRRHHKGRRPDYANARPGSVFRTKLIAAAVSRDQGVASARVCAGKTI